MATLNVSSAIMAENLGSTPPKQYKSGELCAHCRKVPLSRYNQTNVCGACRLFLEKTILKDRGGEPHITKYWQKYLIKLPKRTPVKAFFAITHFRLFPRQK